MGRAEVSRCSPPPCGEGLGEGLRRATRTSFLPRKGREARLLCRPSNVVIAGLDPAIHSVTVASDTSVAEWMPGSGPGMTTTLEAW